MHKLKTKIRPLWRRIEHRFLKPHRRAIAVAMGVMFVQALLLLPVPLLQGWVIDGLLTKTWETEHAAMLAIAFGLFATMGLLVLRAILSWHATVSMSRVSLEVVRELTNEMHRKLQRLPLSYFDRQQTGQLMARITSDVGSLLLFLKGSSLSLLCDLILAIGIAALLVAIHPVLAAASLAAVPLYLANYWYFSKAIRQRSAMTSQETANLYALLCERLSAIRLVRSFAQEDAEIDELRRVLDRHRSLSWDSLCIGQRQSMLAIFVGGMGTLVCLGCGAWFVNLNQLSVGNLLAFYSLLGQLYFPLLRLTQFSGVVSGTRVAVERMAEILEHGEPRNDGLAPCGVFGGSIEIRDVSFRYASEGPTVLTDITLKIEPGMKVGIVGGSGSGKSTLLSLLPRLYSPTEGTIHIAGQEIRDVAAAELRTRVVLVPQQAPMFDGTLRSNLAYGRPDATEEDLYRVLDMVALSDFVESLPLALDTPIGDRGVTLSGGQRQRLALGRALVADPAVLLLDDSTSALDTQTEAVIQRELRRREGRTMLVVSHRVATVLDADLIIVLRGGRIVEQGTPAVLRQLGGEFADLCRRQLGRPATSLV